MHEFHFVVNSETKEKLLNYSKLKNISLNETLNFILNKTMAYIQNNHYCAPEEKNKYPKVNWNRHIHIYMHEGDYRRLKLIHADLNVFSIAKLARQLIEIFFNYLDLYGEKQALIYFFNFEEILRQKISSRFLRTKQLSYSESKLPIHTYKFIDGYKLFEIKIE